MTAEMTDSEATDEAVLLLVRKLRRTERDAFDRLMAKLPDDVIRALDAADLRASVYRTKVGIDNIVWPAEPDYGDEE